ncbi:diguanylate cyclase [Halorhodospira halochloris]|uniref:diguanylate cyclase n=1 Tax=Halorhodospira halochloris TaxID=1052 RepID=UPI001EE870C7|nr:diguanylate cyclase [Halorhodospira halochloris]MCG5548524.1 diguanylate cyclase [Halorhodospira halochloris]
MSQKETKEAPRVLVVDDQPSNIQVLAHLLKRDYEIQVATGGQKALELATSEPQPDLILLDVVMPDPDGYEVCRRLKEAQHTQNIPVIFVTGRNTAADEERGLELGAVDYIVKPFVPGITRKRVRNHIDLKRRTDELEHLAQRDGLTDLPNRRRFDQQLKDEWARAQRGSTPISLIMMDIDHFKAYNDNYGHGAGDECLRRVAGALARVPNRNTDLVARYGGEEFVVLLPYTDADGARQVAESFRQSVADIAIPHAYSSVANVVSVSVGVATVLPGPHDNDASSLQEAADRALYVAKEHGRNRVEAFVS